MKANELRIGNYINTPRADQSPFRIDVIEFSSKNNIKVGMNVHKLPHPFNENEFIDAHPITWELNDIKPIQLTEEILLKCGFTFMNKNKLILNGLVVFIFKYGIIYRGEFIDTNIKSLHQLQNLYYALTGQELEIQL